MNSRGFTLIEIIVTLAIVSILVGIIVPFSYRAWEASEINLTIERMEVLKNAMTGDPAYYQQGIPTSFGFVGDNGELPATLADLLTDQRSYPNWNGPYLGTGIDPRSYAEDAWGEPIGYETFVDALGRRVAASLTSKGPDRIAGTSDDLDAASAPTVQVSQADVTPTDTVQGNLAYSISVSEYDETPVYSATLHVRYRDAGGEATMSLAECIPLDIGLVQKLVPRSGTTGFAGNFPAALPIGGALLSSRLFAGNSCSGTPLATTPENFTYVTPGVTTLRLTPPALYYHIDNGP